MTRVTESFTTGPEAKGIYPSPNICCYLRYKCAYCERKFFMVSPITFLADGAIMREQYRNHDNPDEVIKTNNVQAVCIQCMREIMRRQAD